VRPFLAELGLVGKNKQCTGYMLPAQPALPLAAGAKPAGFVETDATIQQHLWSIFFRISSTSLFYDSSVVPFMLCCHFVGQWRGNRMGCHTTWADVPRLRRAGRATVSVRRKDVPPSHTRTECNGQCARIFHPTKDNVSVIKWSTVLKRSWNMGSKSSLIVPQHLR
jgi:hypothetical protein